MEGGGKESISFGRQAKYLGSFADSVQGLVQTLEKNMQSMLPFPLCQHVFKVHCCPGFAR